MDKREELRSVLNNMIENTPEAREAASQQVKCEIYLRR